MPNYSSITLTGFLFGDASGPMAGSPVTLSAITSEDFALSYTLNFATQNFDLTAEIGALHSFRIDGVEFEDPIDMDFWTTIWGDDNVSDLLYVFPTNSFDEIFVFELGGDPITDPVAFVETFDDVFFIDSGPFQPDVFIRLGSIPGISISPIDTILGTAQANILNGGDEDDVIEGRGGNDVLEGRLGADMLFGGAGVDILRGDAGNDVLEGGSNGDALFGGSGLDTAAYATAGAGVEADLGAQGGSRGNAAGDTYTSIENLLGSEFADALRGSSGNNVIGGGGGDDFIFGAQGNDTLDGGEGDDVIQGRADNDALAGGAGSDLLEGGTGDDSLSGGRGADILNGGTGSDLLEGGGGADLIDGGPGADIDTASYQTAASGVVLNLTAGFGTAGNANGDTFISIENLIGSDFDDVLIGSADDNQIMGGTGDDALRGSAGDDILDGGAGADFLNGGSGVDTVSYASAQFGVILHLGDNRGIAGDALGDTFFRIENVLGTRRADTITGDDGANDLNGGRGNDIIRGGRGDDVIVGGTGSDQLYGGGGADTFEFRPNNGNDRVYGFNLSMDRFQLIGLDPAEVSLTEINGVANINYGSGSIFLVGISQAQAEAELVMDFV